MFLKDIPTQLKFNLWQNIIAKVNRTYLFFVIPIMEYKNKLQWYFHFSVEYVVLMVDLFDILKTLLS